MQNPKGLDERIVGMDIIKPTHLIKTIDAYVVLGGLVIVGIFFKIFEAFRDWVIISQNKKANEINNRLLKIEEINSVPGLCILEEKTMFVEYSENTIWLKVYVKNLSNGIIEIKSVSDLNIHVMISEITGTLEFSHKCLDFPTLLPGQEKQLDFSLNKHNKHFPLCEIETIQKCDNILYYQMTFNITMGYKDASTTYKEFVKLCANAKFSALNNASISEQRITRSDYKLQKLQ